MENTHAGDQGAGEKHDREHKGGVSDEGFHEFAVGAKKGVCNTPLS